MLRAVLGLGIALLGLLSSQAQAASFGYAENSKRDSWVITTGAGLVVTVHKASCDIKSLLYNGQELQSRLRGSHVNSGLGSVSSSIQSFTDGKASAQISCSQTGLVHYYLFRANENNIYMGTYNTAESNMPNLRWITRLDRKTIASGPVAADISGGVTAVEGSDVFLSTKTGDTRSKFYSAIPFYQDNSHKAWGSAGAVHMIIGQGGYESSLGGPFFRDHDNQVTDDTSELYFVPYSSHSQTESIRYGFHGPYALAFTSGGDPSGVDFTFFQRRSLMGFVPDSSRGQVNGKIRDGNEVLNGAASVVHFYNEQAQYWTMSNNNNFVSPMMKPGTYDVSVYRKELEVGTTKVTVSRGSTTTIPIDVTFVETKPIWRIGEWDGTPDGFLNADKIHYMHPSDHRMAAWTKSFVVGSTSASQFPMALFRAVNAPLTIQCSLTAAQASSTLTLRVGVTLAQSAARPIINVNNKWSSPIPASYAIKSRGVTRGVTSGNYFVYEYAVPASAWQSGTNSIVMSIASGVTDPDGTPFLSASVVFDAVELVGSASTPTTAPTTAPTPAPTSTPTPSQSHDTPAPTTPAPTSSGSVAKYGQCGGSNYSGPTTCKDSTCTKVNDYYSQCL